MLMTIERIKKSIRWQDWAVDKLPVLFFIYFYFLSQKTSIVTADITDFFMFVIFSIISTIYGYMINNYGDLEIDEKQGKENYLLKLSHGKRIVLNLTIFLAVVITGLYFIEKKYFLILWIVQFFIATFYSLKPIRFKERGRIGLLIPFFAQLVLPSLICLSIIGKIFSIEGILFVVYAMFKGGAYDIGHQFIDYLNDKKTNTKTFAVIHGQDIIKRLYDIFLIIERIMFITILFLITCSVKLVWNDNQLLIFLPVLILHLLLVVFLSYKEISKKMIHDPYYLEIRGLSNIIHIIIPNIIVPLIITFVLAVNYTIALLLFIFFLIWVMPTPAKLMWPIKVILRMGK